MKLPRLQHGATFLVYLTVTSTVMTKPSNFNIYIKDLYGNNVATCEVGETPIDDKLSVMVRNTYNFEILKHFLIIADAANDEIMSTVEFDVSVHSEQFPDNFVIILDSTNMQFSGHLTVGELYGVKPDPSVLLESESGGEPAPDSYVHTQMVPNSRWVVSHFMNKFPSVVVVDSGGTTVYGEIIYVDKNIVNLEFSYPFSGKAFLN